LEPHRSQAKCGKRGGDHATARVVGALNIATAARLFHASDGTGFVDFIIDGHRETWPLRGKRFQAWLRQQYYERTWDAPSPAALNAGLNALEARGQFDGPQRKVSVRLAEQEARSTSIWRMSSGAASKSAPMDGGSPRTLRSGSAAAPASSHFQSRCGADQLRRSRRF
jgi:hypothetical protein